MSPKRDAVSTGEVAVEGGTSPAYRREESSSIAPQRLPPIESILDAVASVGAA